MCTQLLSQWKRNRWHGVYVYLTNVTCVYITMYILTIITCFLYIYTSPRTKVVKQHAGQFVLLGSSAQHLMSSFQRAILPQKLTLLSTFSLFKLSCCSHNSSLSKYCCLYIEPCTKKPNTTTAFVIHTFVCTKTEHLFVC